jgi:K+/H+ antiporter YhaU regulatory subunit KhtT
MVVAIKRGDGITRFNPGAQEIIHPGDRLITIGPSGAVAELESMDIGNDDPVSA